MAGAVTEGMRGKKVQELLRLEGRDEMNLAEFPIASVADRLPAEVKTLVFEDETRDPVTREPVLRKLTISGSDRFGLPTAADEEVIVGLIQLTRRDGFQSPTVHFSRYELIQVLGWREEGKSYDRIETAINRWLGVTLYWDNAWWDKEDESWANVKFGIIDNAVILDKKRYERRKKAGTQMPMPLSWFKWNEVMFKSFEAGNLKRLDMDLFRALDSAVSKRMYRFLDKRFYHRRDWQFDLFEFAFEKIGLSRSYAGNAGKVKEKLGPAIKELEGVGYLEPMPREKRYVRIGQGQWKVVFEKKNPEPVAIETDENSDLVAALEGRGVHGKVARELVASASREKVLEKIEVLDWLVGRKDERVKQNPAGFLVKAIREDYVLPPGFTTKAEREAKRAVAEKKQKAMDQALRREQEESDRQRREAEERVAKYMAALPSDAARDAFEEESARAHPMYKLYKKAKDDGGEFFSVWRFAVLKCAVERELGIRNA